MVDVSQPIIANAPGLPQSKDRIHSLDSIRGIAASVVLIHHCFLLAPDFCDYFFQWIKYGKTLPPQNLIEFIFFKTPARLVWCGFEAVTLFYVLSGFVLALPWIAGKAPGYFTYAIRRFCRLYIPYIVIIAICALLSWQLHVTQIIPGVSYWVNSYNWAIPVSQWAIVDHIFMLGNTDDLNGVVHSLVWEMRVSAIFPFMMLLIWRWKQMGAIALLVGTVVGMAILELAARKSGSELTSHILRDIEKTLFYSHHFTVGAIIAFNLSWIRRQMGKAPDWVALVLLAVGLLIMQARWSTVSVVQAAMVGVGSAAVIVAAISSPSIQKVLSLPFLVWLGEISYSFYLVHVPIILTLVLVLHAYVPIWLIVVSVPLISLLVASLYHRFIALPAVALGRRLAPR